MKIFFLASINVDGKLKQDFKLISQLCTKLGHEVNDAHLFETTLDLEQQTEQSLEQRARKLLSEMYEADALIFEGTHPTTGGGYYISSALQRQIPVLFLVQKKYTGLYLADQARLLKIARYFPDDPAELQTILQDFFVFAQKRGLNNRFNLMIDDATVEYLDQVSKTHHVSKSDYIRTLINKDRETTQKS